MARNDLLDQVSAFVVEHALWAPGSALVVAVSGGPDSLGLLHLLKRLAPAQRLALHVAHLDHALRPESAADADFVRDIAAAWRLPCAVERRPVRDILSDYGGVEAAARAVRYGFLRDTALAVGAAAVVTGHTADDQAETVLQRLLRGAGPSGLAGMRPKLPFDQWRGIGAAASAANLAAPTPKPALVRPLLRTSRTMIEAYCAENALRPRYDPSNQSPEYLRNRVRGYIIPMLKSYNSNIVGALGRTARICAEEDALLNELLDRAWPALAHVQSSKAELKRPAFGDLHRALQRRALRKAVALVAPGVELGAEHLDRMMRLTSRMRGRLQLPGGLWMYVDRNMIILERAVEA
jgi:tRNA(Ile)-lysidine synthase